MNRPSYDHRPVLSAPIIIAVFVALGGLTWLSPSSPHTSSTKHSPINVTAIRPVAPTVSDHQVMATITRLNVERWDLTELHLATVRRQEAAARAAALAASSSAPTRSAPSSTEASGSTWTCIIQRESGGDPTAVNRSSGDSGLYQFSTGTWLSNGGGQYAPTAAQATPAEQTAIAIATQARSGWSPWASDGCAG